MSNEVEKAQDSAPSAKPTLFDKIVAGEIPCNKVYEDDLALAFRDVSPQAPTHILVIPKNRGRLSQLSLATEEDKDLVGHLFLVAGMYIKALLCLYDSKR